MKNFHLGEGLLIKRNNGQHRFLRQVKDTVYFERLDDGGISELKSEEFFSELFAEELTVLDAKDNGEHITTSSPEEYLDFQALPKKTRQNALRRYEYVMGMKKRGISRGSLDLITEAAEEIFREISDKKIPSTSSVSAWMKKYEESGEEFSNLISKYHISNSQNRIETQTEALAGESIENIYLTLQSRSGMAAYEYYCDMVRIANNQRTEKNRPPLKPISERTFYRRIEKLPKEQVVSARKGKQTARKLFRMSKGHLKSDFALEYAEIDATPVDLFVIDDKLMLPLGRPTITVIKDRYSTALIGLFASFNGSGLDSVFGAIKHSLFPRTIKKRFDDLENEWLGGGIAYHYVSDNGPEYKSFHYRSAIAELGSAYEYNRVRTPWHKGIVERTFHTINSDLMESIPGRTFSIPATPDNYNPQKYAVVRFTTFIYLLHKWAVDMHNIKVNKRLGGRPIDIWNEGIRNHPPVYPANLDSLNKTFGISYRRRLRHDGILLHHLNYANTELKDLRKSLGTELSVDIKLNPADVSKIYVTNPRTRKRFTVNALRYEYAENLSLYQHKYIIKITHQRAKNTRIVDADHLMKTRYILAETINEEVDRFSTLEKIRLARLSGIGSEKVIQGKEASLLNLKDLPSDKPLNIFQEKDIQASSDISWMNLDEPFTWSVSEDVF